MYPFNIKVSRVSNGENGHRLMSYDARPME